MFSKLDVINEALAQLGVKSISSINEDSDRADKARLFYERVVRAELRRHPWKCAIRRQELVKLNEDAPDDIHDWQGVFQLPTDPLCIRALNVEGRHDERWQVEGRTLLSEKGSVTLRYIARVNEGEWDPLLVEVISAKLAAEMAVPLRESRTLAQQLWNIYTRKIEEAGDIDMLEQTSDQMRSNHLTGVRRATSTYNWR